MPAAKMLSTVAVTGILAFASGFVMENGKSAFDRISDGMHGSGMAQASIAPDVPHFPRPPIQTLQATPLPTTKGWSRMQPASMDLSELDRSWFSSDSQLACNTDLTAAPSGHGMMRVTLVAPCNADEAVTLRHSGLDFTMKTGANGRLSVEMPALTRDVQVEAVLQGGLRIKDSTQVPDADLYQRVALVWRGEGGLHIHAQEFGAELGGTGHIWAGSPGRDDLGPNAKGGHMKVYGDREIANATRAEVYTFPAETSAQDGVVRLFVQADVTNTNCGALAAARTLQPDGAGGVSSSDVTLRLPECDNIGEQLVLNNVLRDLMIASTH